jgi:hypothetical protein
MFQRSRVAAISVVTASRKGIRQPHTSRFSAKATTRQSNSQTRTEALHLTPLGKSSDSSPTAHDHV